MFLQKIKLPWMWCLKIAERKRAHGILSESGKHGLLGIDPLSLARYSARKDYMFIREFPAGREFADVVFLPLPSVGKPALEVELKYDKTADAAIRRLKDRKYPQALEGYTGEILLVGINYDKKNSSKPASSPPK